LIGWLSKANDVFAGGLSLLGLKLSDKPMAWRDEICSDWERGIGHELVKKSSAQRVTHDILRCHG
jgi:hypothetical protein